MPVEFVDYFPEIMLAGNRGTAEAVEQTAIAIEQGSKERSRWDTGNMRSGWESEQEGPMTWQVFNNVYYTIFHELGTVYMSAQPMLIPSIEEAAQDFPDMVREAWVG